MEDLTVKKIRNWVLGILLFLILLIGGAALYISKQWKPILDSQLKALVISSSDSLIDLRRNVILPDINNKIILKGEIFDSHNISILQFERNLNSDKSIKINENYKKENSIINLSYSVST